MRGLIEELLAAGGEVDHGDAMRRLLEAGLQELIEAQVAVRIGAGRYERSADRVTHRNGTRAKQLATPAGQVELAIPKLREGSFFPCLLEPRRRIDQALWAVIAQAWIQGVSTRRVDQFVKALGNEAGISRSQVSRICAEIDEYVAVLLTRRLDENDTWYPYVWLDATYLDVRPAAARSWQRCRVHFARNVTQALGSARSKPVNALIGTVFAQTNAEAVTA